MCCNTALTCPEGTAVTVVCREVLLTTTAVSVVRPLPPHAQLPFEEVETDSRITLPFLRENQDVMDLRDLHKADLVQMISGKMTFCGLG